MKEAFQSAQTAGNGTGEQGMNGVDKAEVRWLLRYGVSMVLLALLWAGVYMQAEAVSGWLVFNLSGLAADSPFAAALQFFLYDTVKILLLLVALIYVIAWLRAGLNPERVRAFLAGRKRGLGYVLAALFGAVSPFCSCSSVPLFLGFTSAGIPLGITMAFLITSPIINEVAVVLLWGLLGWKFTVVYAGIGIGAGIAGGCFMDAIRADRWLQPLVRDAMKTPLLPLTLSRRRSRLSVYQRHRFAWGETVSIFRRVWKWIIAGVCIGAAIHGLVPANWFEEHLGTGQWWTVPAAVIAGIPLYSSVTGIVPVMEGLLGKGMPVGTTLAFCMSAVAASIPEVVMLKQVMTNRLQAVFIGYLWVMFTLAGWALNTLQGVLF
ncbi:permease [uncultured Mailhella sp.]|uniref:permease n=1 Tax=uncultured Mailhella sp. TaxID=1981031 RepID=UPI002623FD40|nr:permease [uncultured Mailhella sp.]